jgi:hypothetical protein
MAKNNTGSNGTVAGIPVNVTLKDIGNGWKGTQGTSGVLLWRFARMAMACVDAKIGTLEEVGTAMANGVGRANPYDKSYVSRMVKAARNTPNEPANPQDAAAFTDLAYGNGAAKAKKASGEATPEDAIARLRASVKTARNKGNTEDAIRAAVEAALRGDTEDASE